MTWEIAAALAIFGYLLICVAAFSAVIVLVLFDDVSVGLEADGLWVGARVVDGEAEVCLVPGVVVRGSDRAARS